MKIYLASFMQKDNFGPGRVIGIVRSAKPQNVKVDVIFEPLTPHDEIMSEFNKLRAAKDKEAGPTFVKKYSSQLEEFAKSVLEMAQEKNVSPQEILPFKDGDTLASWERKEYTHYRSLVAPILEKLGYEVFSN